jgi:hypothetical protein
MRFARIDFSADYAWFFIGFFILALIFIVALERASPKRRRKRRAVRDVQQRTGELID